MIELVKIRIEIYLTSSQASKLKSRKAVAAKVAEERRVHGRIRKGEMLAEMPVFPRKNWRPRRSEEGKEGRRGSERPRTSNVEEVA